MAKYSKGSKIDFKRNALVCGENISVIAEVKKAHKDQPQHYIIENEYGWNPDPLRKKLYGLDEKKKYLFASESELHPAGTLADKKKELEVLQAARIEAIKANEAARIEAVKAVIAAGSKKIVKAKTKKAKKKR